MDAPVRCKSSGVVDAALAASRRSHQRPPLGMGAPHAAGAEVESASKSGPMGRRSPVRLHSAGRTIRWSTYEEGASSPAGKGNVDGRPTAASAATAASSRASRDKQWHVAPAAAADARIPRTDVCALAMWAKAERPALNGKASAAARNAAVAPDVHTSSHSCACSPQQCSSTRRRARSIAAAARAAAGPVECGFAHVADAEQRWAASSN